MDKEMEISEMDKSRSVDAAFASPGLGDTVVQKVVDWLCAGRQLDPFVESLVCVMPQHRYSASRSLARFLSLGCLSGFS